MRPLSLSDTQLNLVTRAAGLSPTHDRCQFLRSVGSRVGDVANPSDHDIQDAITFILNLRGIAGGNQAFRPTATARQVKHKESTI